MNRAVITGFGCVSPFGAGKDIFRDNIFAGNTAARLITNSEIILKINDPEGTPGQGSGQVFDASSYPTRFCADVPLTDAKLNSMIENQKSLKTMSRSAKMAMIAADEAMEESGYDSVTLNPRRLGTSIGAGGLGLWDIDYTDNFLKLLLDLKHESSNPDAGLWYEISRRIHPLTPLKALPNIPTALIAIKYNAGGDCLTVTTACTSSAQAIGSAYRKIKFGLLDAVICGGSDSMTTPFGLSAFSTLGVISKNNDEYLTSSRPFDKTRDGFMIGAGAAMFVIEEYEHCMKRGGVPLAEIAGYASTNDAYRLTDEPPDAGGSTAAIKLAMEDAQVNAGDIDYINAHGTSTKMNDKTETLAIKNAMGARAYKIPVSSTKSMIGHLVAAAGAIELGACLLAMKNNIIPPTINYKVPDPDCDLDYVPNVARSARLNTILSNSFGFGGQNACLILKRI